MSYLLYHLLGPYLTSSGSPQTSWHQCGFEFLQWKSGGNVFRPLLPLYQDPYCLLLPLSTLSPCPALDLLVMSVLELQDRLWIHSRPTENIPKFL